MVLHGEDAYDLGERGAAGVTLHDRDSSTAVRRRATVCAAGAEHGPVGADLAAEGGALRRRCRRRREARERAEVRPWRRAGCGRPRRLGDLARPGQGRGQEPDAHGSADPYIYAETFERRLKNRKESSELKSEHTLTCFSNAGLTEIASHLVSEITGLFSKKEKIGSNIYKGILDGAKVVVKGFKTNQLSYNFARTLSVLGHHKNIARFVYFSNHRSIQIFVVGEYYQGEDLEHIINGELIWQVRAELIRGIAEGIAHMHSKNIIHSDLNPSNVLLDSNMTPKISGFEISKILDEENPVIQTDVLMGRQNYMAPEYVRHRTVSVKNDVYSFGVFLLCIITKNRYMEDPRIGTRHLDERAAEILGLCSGFSESEKNMIDGCIEIGLRCTQENPQHRPIMPGVLKMLDDKGIVRTEDGDEMELLFKYKNEGSEPVDPSSSVTEVSNGPCGMHDQSKLDKTYSSKELTVATRGFSHEIGESDDSKSYKGKLKDGTVVSVRKFHTHWRQASIKRYKDYFTPLFQHTNILRVLGYCEEPGYEMVVEEYSRSLPEFINGPKDMDWPSRFQIIRGVASALDHLHSRNIIHFNLTPANIAIVGTGSHMSPKICDFGLSKIIDYKYSMNGGVLEKEAEEFEITAGSTAPEYVDGVISVKNDIYSFGELVCILSGMSRSESPQDFTDVAMAVRVARRKKDLFDPSSCKSSQLKEIKACMDIGLKCTKTERGLRPTIKEVLGTLNKTDP